MIITLLVIAIARCKKSEPESCALNDSLIISRIVGGAEKAFNGTITDFGYWIDDENSIPRLINSWDSIVYSDKKVLKITYNNLLGPEVTTLKTKGNVHVFGPGDILPNSFYPNSSVYAIDSIVKIESIRGMCKAGVINLGLVNCNLSQKHVQALGECKQLKYLNLSENTIVDVEAMLQDMKDLRVLILPESLKIPAKSMVLELSKLIKLRANMLSPNSVLKALSNLKELIAVGNWRKSREISRPSQITALSVSGNYEVKLKNYTKLKALTWSLSSSHLRRITVPAFIGLKHLKIKANNTPRVIKVENASKIELLSLVGNIRFETRSNETNSLKAIHLIDNDRMLANKICKYSGIEQLIAIDSCIKGLNISCFPYLKDIIYKGLEPQSLQKNSMLKKVYISSESIRMLKELIRIKGIETVDFFLRTGYSDLVEECPVLPESEIIYAIKSESLRHFEITVPVIKWTKRRRSVVTKLRSFYVYNLGNDIGNDALTIIGRNLRETNLKKVKIINRNPISLEAREQADNGKYASIETLTLSCKDDKNIEVDVGSIKNLEVENCPISVAAKYIAKTTYSLKLNGIVMGDQYIKAINKNRSIKYLELGSLAYYARLDLSLPYLQYLKCDSTLFYKGTRLNLNKLEWKHLKQVNIRYCPKSDFVFNKLKKENLRKITWF